MLKIKLTRTGKRNQPSYRVIVAEARSKNNGKFVDWLGFYNPLTKPKTLKINRQSYLKWVAKGAQPTLTVKRLFKTLA
jgi:small subunit ribosomal protein S16